MDSEESEVIVVNMRTNGSDIEVVGRMRELYDDRILGLDRSFCVNRNNAFIVLYQEYSEPRQCFIALSVEPDTPAVAFPCPDSTNSKFTAIILRPRLEANHVGLFFVPCTLLMYANLI